MSTKELTNIEIISAGLAGVSGNKAAVVTQGRNQIIRSSKIDLFLFFGGRCARPDSSSDCFKNATQTPNTGHPI
jgi:hypothetical protein